MKKKLFAKRLTALLLATALVVTGTGCGKGKDSKKSEKADTSNCTYKESEETLPEEIKDVNSVVAYEDTLYFYCSTWIEDGTVEGDASKEDSSEADTSEDATSEEDSEATTEESTTEADTSEDSSEEDSSEDSSEEDSDELETPEESEEEYKGHSENHLYAVDVNTNELTELTLPELSESEWISYMTCDSKGNIYYIKGSYSEKDGKQSYYIAAMDNTGKEILNKDITSDVGTDDESYIGSMRMDGEDNIYLSSGDKAILIFDKDGNKTGEVTADGYLMGIAKAKDGSIVAGINDNETGELQLCVLDTKNKKFGSPKKLEGITNYSSDSLINGKDYDIYFQGSDGLYGYTLESGEPTKIMDYLASNVSSQSANTVLPLSADKILISGYGNDSYAASIYTKVDPKDVEDRIDITYAGVYVMDEIKTAAINFNKSSDKYRIVIKDYSTGDDPETEMATDLLAGNVPDIIDLSSSNTEQYIAKGMLEDLYPMLEADKDISKDDFIPSALKTLEQDGKLYSIASSFYVNTLVGATEDVGDKPGWTVKDLIELDESKGKDVTALGQSSQADVIYTLVAGNIDNYVDWSTGKCSFDSEEFVDILNYAATYPEEYEYNEDDESYPSQVKNGKILLITGSVSLDEMQLYKQMFGKDVTFKGYPAQEGTGTYASFQNQMGISSKSENKEAAWEFVKSFLTEDASYEGMHSGMMGVPMRKDTFEEFIKERTTTKGYTDSHGNEITPYESSWGWDDLEVAIKPSSDEEVQTYRDLIDSLSGTYSYNNKIMEIITEETEEFFKGKNDAKTAAGNINNRVSTYVNENR